MSKLEIKEGKNTPKVVFNPGSSQFAITGKSFPENAKKFYEPVFSWLDTYNGSETMNVEISLYYISSSSIIAILEVIRRLDKISANTDVSINWYFDEDDEDIKKIGEDYQRISKVPITLVAN